MSTEKIKIKDLLNYGEKELKELMKEVIVDKSKELDWIDFNEKVFEYVRKQIKDRIEDEFNFLCLPDSLHQIYGGDILKKSSYNDLTIWVMMDNSSRDVFLNEFSNFDLRSSEKYINNTRGELIINEEREEGVISIDDFVVCYGIEENDGKDIWIFDTPKMITNFFEYILKLLMKVIEEYKLNKKTISSFFSEEENEKLESADEEESKMKKMIKNVFE